MRYEPEDPQDKTKAQVNLIKVKSRDAKEKKIYKLRITSTLSIMVAKRNFNRKYAESYRSRLESSQGYGVR